MNSSKPLSDTCTKKGDKNSSQETKDDLEVCVEHRIKDNLHSSYHKRVKTSRIFYPV